MPSLAKPQSVQFVKGFFDHALSILYHDLYDIPNIPTSDRELIVIIQTVLEKARPS